MFIINCIQSVLSEVSEKGWNRLNNVGEIKEVEVKAMFNFIDKDKSGSLSLDVKIICMSVCILILVIIYMLGGKKSLQANSSKI